MHPGQWKQTNERFVRVTFSISRELSQCCKKTNTTRYDCANIKVNWNYLVSISFWLSCWWNFWEIPISDELETNTIGQAGNWISILIHWWTFLYDMQCFSKGNIWISVLISFIDSWHVELFYNRALMNTGTGYHERTKMSFITFRAKYRFLASLVL